MSIQNYTYICIAIIRKANTLKSYARAHSTKCNRPTGYNKKIRK